jgi:hypothetical protein
VTAFATAVIAGIAVGVLTATRGWASGVRPRHTLRVHKTFANRAAWTLIGICFGLAPAAIATADHLRTTLGVTCAAAALLLAAATWLLAVEPDEGGEPVAEDEPHWWPEFERELAAWERSSRKRVPTLSRH